VLNLRAFVGFAVLCPKLVAAQWTWVPTGTSAEFRGVSVGADGAVWASGARGTFARSLDGGRTWTSSMIPGAATLDFRSLYARDAATAFVASAGEAEKGMARIFATSDSGRTWRTRWATLQPGVFLDALAFWDARHGIAVSDPVDSAFFVLTTSDGGVTWQRVARERLPRVLPGEAAFAASNSCLAIVGTSDAWIGTGGGGRARVFHTADRGVTWTVRETPVHAAGAAAGIFALAFSDTRTGIVVGGDYTKPALAATSVALTRDGGRTWSAASAPPAAYLSGVAYGGSAARVVAVGLTGTFVSRDSGQTWSRTDSIALNAVRFRGKRGYAVGPRGRAAYVDSLVP
jgi:photosystem II stability/assembly factor-like uncharacterized protein